MTMGGHSLIGRKIGKAPDAMTRFSLEDVFAGEDGNSGKRAWVTGWRKLPHLTREVAALFDYPQQFAEDAYARVEQALSTRVSNDEANAVAQTGRLFVVPADNLQAESETAPIPDLEARYIWSSDMQLVAAQKADAYDETQLLSDRREGKFLVSYKTPGGWVAIAKTMLTEVLGAERDVKIVGMPAEAAGALQLMCPSLVILPEIGETAARN